MADDSVARDYEVGVKYKLGADKAEMLVDDPAFYLFATAGIYHEQDILKLDPESTNWIGFVGIGPGSVKDGKLDIAIAFRGTEVRLALTRLTLQTLPDRHLFPRAAPSPCRKESPHFGA